MRDVMRGLHRKILAATAVGLAALAAPAGAQAASNVLRPDATTFAGWIATPSGTASWEALNDTVFAMTPPSTASDYLSTGTTGTTFTEVSVDTFAIPAGESVTGATIWVYAQTGTIRDLYAYAQTGPTVLGNGTVPPNSPAGWYPIPVAAPTTQAQVDGLKMGFSHNGTSGTPTLLYAAYLQVDTTDPPADDPPADDPPADDPPADDPPADDPPADDPPADDPPADDPPADDPPADDPPADPVYPPTLPSDPVDPPTLPSDPVDPTLPADPVDPTLPTDPAKPPVVDPDDVLEPALDIAGGNAPTTASESGVVAVQLACPDTSVEGCTGTLWFEEALDAGSKSQRISSARRSPKRFSKPKKYKLRRGQRKSVPVRLDRRVHRKFKRKRSFKVTVVAQQKDPSGQVVTMRRTVRVFNKKAKKKPAKRSTRPR
jgi:hypothetical protein